MEWGGVLERMQAQKEEEEEEENDDNNVYHR